MKWNYSMNKEKERQAIATSPFYKIFALVGKTWPKEASYTEDV